MFERFTERARQTVVLAQDEARALRHDHIDTEHLLLGLLREEEGLAARVLESFEIAVEQVRDRVRQIAGEGDVAPTGQMPFTPRAKKVLELSLREALALDHRSIGTEHLLLALARLNDGVAARILVESGADAEAVRDQVLRMLSEPGVGRAAAAAPLGEHGSAGLLELLVRLGKLEDDAIYAGDDEALRDLREQEHALLDLSRRHLAARAGDEPEQADETEAAGRRSRLEWRFRPRSRPRGVARYAPSAPAPAGGGQILLPWLLGVATLGLGILIGRAISG